MKDLADEVVVLRPWRDDDVAGILGRRVGSKWPLQRVRIVLAVKSAAMPDVLSGKDLLQGNGLSQAGGALFQVLGAGIALRLVVPPRALAAVMAFGSGALISALAFDAQRDAGLVAVNAAHLFESNTTRLALRRGTYLRRCDYDLIELFAPHLSRHVVDMAMQGGGAEYQL